ncbi:2-dehydro-3-deoxygluconokinase [Streptomyces sp. YIM 130001]|uniref:sugar kinase n=1 Tax=Streptomyces sp. YIM 130001 TaxID=2259644 RepID=UPI000E64DFB8|nr:sugar kinase [Streptomyces sp. YIM 130001]RII19616.1 2-dehydro-3-deoxygluconokinase [Streptomyces sp. YIM 130001]
MNRQSAVDLTTLGETLAVLAPDHIGPLRHARSLGLTVAGSESTVAIGVRRLGHSAAWAGRVGDDELGRLVTDRLRGEDLRVHAVTDASAPTGLFLKDQPLAGSRRVHYYRGGSAGSHLCPEDLPPGVVEGSRVVHTSGITSALSDAAARTVRTALARARSVGVTVSFDLNHRTRLWSDERARTELWQVVPLVDLLFASDDEAALLVPEAGGDPERAAHALREHGPETVVVTMGAAGSLSVGPEGVRLGAAPAVLEVDPIGAGDSFVAGYLSAFLDGCAEPERLVRASAVAAVCVATQGDWEGLPDRAVLELALAPAGTVTR